MSEEPVTELSDEPVESQQTTEVPDSDAANGEQQNSSSDDDRKIFVGGLSWETSESDLNEYMSQFGKVVSCNLKKDLETNRSRGFGFVVFEESETIDKVLSKKDHKLQGKTIDPKRANPKGKFQEPPIKKIYVGKVSPSITEEQIKEYFSQWGKIEKIETSYDKEKKERRNFVFVEFETEDGLNKVLNHTVENPDYKHKIGSDEIEIRKATPGNRGRGRGGYFRGADYSSRGGRGGTDSTGYGGYGGWSDGYSNQAYSGYGGGYGSGYGGGYGGYGSYGGYGYDPNYSSYGYGSGWGGYDPSYYGYGGYDYSGGWGGYGDQSSQQVSGYGKAPKPARGGSGYRPY